MKKSHLSENDQKHVLPTLLKLLKSARGPHKAINNQWIARVMKAKASVILHHRQIQLLIRDARLTGQINCLVGDSLGYYIAQTPRQAHDYEVTLISRINEITELLKVFHQQNNKKFGLKGSLAEKIRKIKSEIKKVQQPLSFSAIDKQFNAFKKARRTFKYIITPNGVSIIPGKAMFQPGGKSYPDTFVTTFIRGTAKGTQMFFRSMKSMPPTRKSTLMIDTKNFKLIKTENGYMASWEGYKK